MGTTNTTTGNNSSSLTFNPNSQNLYNMLTSGGGGVLGGYINNPFGNASYTTGAANSQAGAQQAGSNNMAALNQNVLTNGLTGQAGAGFLAAQKAQTGRANQALSSQANISNIMQALQRQMTAAGTGLSYSPQLTGQSGNFSQASSLSGLGTWLPQLLGSVGGAALGGLTKGVTSANPTSGINLNNIPGGSSSDIMSLFKNNSGMAGMGSSGLSGMLGNNNSSGMSPYYASMFPSQQ